MADFREQAAVAQRANLDFFFGLAGKMLEGEEKLVRLNLDMTKTTFADWHQRVQDGLAKKGGTGSCWLAKRTGVALGGEGPDVRTSGCRDYVGHANAGSRRCQCPVLGSQPPGSMVRRECRAKHPGRFRSCNRVYEARYFARHHRL